VAAYGWKADLARQLAGYLPETASFFNSIQEYRGKTLRDDWHQCGGETASSGRGGHCSGSANSRAEFNLLPARRRRFHVPRCRDHRDWRRCSFLRHTGLAQALEICRFE
jgi:hypothetical protein